MTPPNTKIANRSKKYLSISRFILISLLTLTALNGFSQTTAQILIDGSPVYISPTTKFPFWLEAGQTIAVSTNVVSISAIEFNVTTSVTGGKILTLSSVKKINSGTGTFTVSSSPLQTLKVEAVMLNPAVSGAGTQWMIGGNTAPGSPVIGSVDNSAISIQSGTGSLGVGTDAFAKTITIGNSTVATNINENVGGNYTLDGAPSSNYSIGASALGGNITIGGTSQTGTLGLGTGTGTQTINMGTGGTGVKTINIGTGAVANPVALGSTTAGSTVSVKPLTSAGIVTNTATGQLGTTAIIPNSNTTGTSANTANTLVLRDGSGNFSAGTITATGFSGPLTGNVTGNVTGNLAGTALNATNSAITDDVASAGPRYLTWVDATSGNNPLKVSSSKLTFSPSTGTLSATTFSGGVSATSLTGTVPAANLGTGTPTGTTFLAGNGTWAVPSVTLSGGTTNALTYWTGSSAIAAATTGTVANGMYWDNTSGSLGVGTTSPAAKLDLKDLTTGNANGQNILVLESDYVGSTVGSGGRIVFKYQGGSQEAADIRGYTTGGGATGLAFGTGFGAVTTKMLIDNSGSVGIGTTSPQNKLHVNGGMRWGGGTTAPYIYSNEDASGMYIEQVGTTSANSKIRLQSSPTGTQTSYAQFFVDPANGFSFMSTAGGNSTNVGIGTSTPAALLHILSSGNYPRIVVESSTVNGGDLELKSSTGRYQMYLQSSDLRFWDGANDRVTFMNGGNVGIGTTAPGQKLTVAGTVESTAGGFKFPDATVQTTALAVANYVGQLNNAANIQAHTASYCNFSTVQNSDAAVFQVNTTGNFGVTILKAGTIMWVYNQDHISTSACSNYNYIAAYINGGVVSYSLTGYSNGNWQNLNSSGTYSVTAGTTLTFGFPSVSCVNNIDNGAWGTMSILWLGAK